MNQPTPPAPPLSSPPSLSLQPPKPRKAGTRIGASIKRGLGIFLALFLLVGAFAIVDGWRAFGASATGERLARMQRSPQWSKEDNAFVNPEPLYNDVWGSIVAMFVGGEHTHPDGPLDVAPIDPHFFDTPPESGLRVTWFGHAANLIEIDGHRVLTDPVWSHRASPLTWVGPQRWFAPPIKLEDLPAIDAVLISHDHYDHLDYPTMVALKDLPIKYIVPLGIGAHLEYWGVDPQKIIELDWWDEYTFGSESGEGQLKITATPARHASGRFLHDKDSKLWAGYVIQSAQHRVYFSGDTGLFSDMHKIGEKFGAFDVALIETGQYHQAWPDWHIGPEQAVKANRWVQSRLFLPIHWGLFELAMHSWIEPPERALAEAFRTQTPITVPKMATSIEPAHATLWTPDTPHWWPAVSWQTAAEHPIVSTKVAP